MRSMRSIGHCALLAFCLFALAGCGVHTVQTGFRGIKTHFGEVDKEALTEGLYMVNPFTTDVHQIDIRTKKWEGSTDTYTKDVQEARVSFTINYQLDPGAVTETFRTVGEDWENKLIGQVVFQGVKEVIGRWDAVDLISNRQKADIEASQVVQADLKERHILVSGFNITNIQYTKAFNQAVEAKVIAQQSALAAQNQTEQVKQEAQQRVISATAEAQSMKIRADALSQNPKLVSWEAVQKWDGKLPVNMYGGAALPFVDVSK